jgi:enediyne biosynthesis protein E7
MPRRAEAPGPKGLSAGAAFLAMRRDRLRFIEDMATRYGKVSRLAIGGRKLVLVSSKSGILDVLQRHATSYSKGMGLAEGREFFGDGLVTSEADTWHAQRTSLTPFFRNAGFSAWNAPIRAAISRSIEEIAAQRADVAGLNLADTVGDLSCTILSRTIIGAPLDARAVRRALMVVDGHVNKKMTSVLPQLPLTQARYARAIAYLDHVTTSIIDHNRRDRGSTSLVSYMLAPPFAGRDDVLRLRDQTRSFLLAGQDNTTSLICWALLLLAANPGVQERLRENLIGRVLDTDVSADVVETQRYACAVILEAMRLFPPVWAIPRHADADTEIDGFHVSAGSDVLLFPYLVHRDPADWHESLRFDPARFLGRDDVRMLSVLSALKRERVFLPFGYGGRSCIGFQHALVVGITVVAALVEAFHIGLPAGSELPAAMPGLSLRPHPAASLRFTSVAHRRDRARTLASATLVVLPDRVRTTARG